MTDSRSQDAQSPDSVPRFRLWRDLVEAVRGSEQDFTRVPLGRAILLLSIPMVLEMVMESVFAIVDIFFVSKLGAAAVATVGITESLITLVYALGMGLSIGTTALVSRRIGEKDPSAAAVAAVQAIAAGLLLSLPIAIPGLLFSPAILKLMGAKPEVLNQGTAYAQIMLASSGIIMLLYIINAVFRAAGDAAVSMRVLWLANGINILLDPCLIFGWGPFPEMGVAGAAWATVIGRGTAVAYQLLLLARSRGRVRIQRGQLRWNAPVLAKLLRLSLGGIGQNLIAMASWIGMVRIIAMFGSVALAGYTIAVRIVIFSLLPSWGLSNSTATLVGQNLGAQRPERAQRVVWITALLNLAFLGLIGSALVIWPDFWIGLFSPEPAVVAAGTQGLFIIALGFLFYGPGMVLVQAFNGAGDTITPTLMNLLCFWLLEIPLAYALAVWLDWRSEGVYAAIVFVEGFWTLLGFILFRRGRWKNRKL